VHCVSGLAHFETSTASRLFSAYHTLGATFCHSDGEEFKGLGRKIVGWTLLVQIGLLGVEGSRTMELANEAEEEGLRMARIRSV
jgi:hypothetical protein